jgi:hypothetical protein
VQGQIVRREAVDVCGVMIDSYRVETTEQLVDLTTGSTSGTTTGTSNVYNVATQLHGFIVREQIRTTTRKADTATGTPVTIEMNYTSTASTTPRA